jgi:hypothetical protein
VRRERRTRHNSGKIFIFMKLDCEVGGTAAHEFSPASIVIGIEKRDPLAHARGSDSTVQSRDRQGADSALSLDPEVGSAAVM